MPPFNQPSDGNIAKARIFIASWEEPCAQARLFEYFNDVMGLAHKEQWELFDWLWANDVIMPAKKGKPGKKRNAGGPYIAGPRLFSCP